MKLWYMTNIPVLERGRNDGKKMGVHALLPMLCRLRFSKYFQSDNRVCCGLNNSTSDFFIKFYRILF